MINREKYKDLRVVHYSEIKEITDKEEFDPDTSGWFFGVEFSRESWTLEKVLERPTIFKFDDPVQRGTDAWSPRKCSEGIASILMNIELGPVKAQKKVHNKKLYRNVIDGGNRLTSQRTFIKNEWALEPDTYIFGEVNEERILIELSDAYFKDLPLIFQRRINGYMFEVHLYDMDDELKNEMYARWNNYEAHSASELLRGHMSAILQVAVNEILQMEFSKVGIGPAKIKKSEHMESILQGFALVETNNQTKLARETIYEMVYSNKLSPETILRVSKTAALLERVFEQIEDKKSAKQIFNKKHKATLIYVASLAFEENASEAHDVNDQFVQAFAAWAGKFFIEDKEISGYYDFGGDGRESNVIKRNEIAVKHYQEFFKSNLCLV